MGHYLGKTDHLPGERDIGFRLIENECYLVVVSGRDFNQTGPFISSSVYGKAQFVLIAGLVLAVSIGLENTKK